VRKSSGIRSWADLKGKPVCVSQGSNYTQPLAETYGALPKGYPSQPESLLALKGGNCVAAVHTGATVKLMVAQHPDEWGDYEIPFADELIPSDSVIWLRKGEADTQARLDQIMRGLYRSGWLIEAAQKNKLAVGPYVLALQDKLKAAP
jgi:polar amino acid transport system substrate-binding protein